MRSVFRSSLILMLIALFTLSAAAFAQDSAPVEITEWTVPWDNSRPRDPWVGSDGRIWFVGQVGDYVATLNPDNGEFRRYELAPGTGPHTVIVDARGAWYAGNRARHIGLIDPDSGSIEKIMMPGTGRGDVHTMDFTRDGDIWFTVQQGNQIGFLDTGTRKVTLYDVPTPSARPYGLLVDKDDRPWVALFGTHKLATVTADGTVREFALPRRETRPRRIALGDDGSVWYVDYSGGYLGRFDPDSGKVDEWRAPAAEHAMPYAMGMDHRGRPWFVETGVQPNRFVGFDPVAAEFTAPVAVGSGGGTVRNMVFDADTHAFWFGTDTNTVGKAALR